ncbi:MAG: hypothetical protein NT139_01470 [Candidatus Woesearchaeota archaeon]|nr:hypothetical protein [Candidatus Woesearchaeota archaeon]
MANLENLSYEALLELRNKALSDSNPNLFGRVCELTGTIPEDETGAEGHLYTMYRANEEYEKRNQIKSQKYVIPGRTEIPCTKKGYDKWIRDFVRMNADKGVRLPKDYGKKSKKQKTGMFYGMLKHYKIKESDILPR